MRSKSQEAKSERRCSILSVNVIEGFGPGIDLKFQILDVALISMEALPVGLWTIES